MKKEIGKALILINLKAIKNEFTVSSSNKDKDFFHALASQRKRFGHSELIRIFVVFITNSKSQLKKTRRSVISKLVQPKRISRDSEMTETNELKMVDTVLKLLIMCIEEIEVGVERLSRQLIRTRVTLLNILSH
ncbi:hypothetical protein CR513_55757, partial [Mucuna pruriens]